MADYIGDFQTRSAARRYRDEVRAYNDYINTQIDASKLRQDVIEQTSEQEKERIMEEAKASKTGGGIYGAVQFKGAADDVKFVKKSLEAKRQDQALSLKLAREELEAETGTVNPLAEEAAIVGDAHEEAVGRLAKSKLKDIRAMSAEEKVAAGLDYATEAKNAEEAMKDASSAQKLLKGAGELAAKGGAAINAIYGGVEGYKSVEKSIQEGHLTIDGNNDFEKVGNVTQMASGVASGLGLLALGTTAETGMLATLAVVAPELLLAGAVLGGASAIIGEVGTFEEEDEKSKQEKEATERAQAAEKAVEQQEQEKLVSAAKAGIPLGGSTRRVRA